MRAGLDFVQAPSGWFGQHQGEREAEDGHPGGEQQRAAQAERGLQHREQEDPDEGAELADPAEIPCPVVRMVTGNSSLGSTKVVMFGPNSVKK